MLRSRWGRDMQGIMERLGLSFGKPEDVEFGTNNICKGGWANVTLPVLKDGTEVGRVFLSYMVWTDWDGHGSQDVHDECKRDGWAVRLSGEERIEPADEDSPLADLDHEEDDELIAAAVEADPTDVGDLFVAALKQRLDRESDSAVRSASVYPLLRAVRALVGDRDED